MGIKLTTKRLQVLRILSRFVDPITSAEIGASRFSNSVSRNGLREWATPALVALHQSGLVEMLGSSFSGARCWRITLKGRAALSEERS